MPVEEDIAALRCDFTDVGDSIVRLIERVLVLEARLEQVELRQNPLMGDPK
jgi:hypothetical protein